MTGEKPVLVTQELIDEVAALAKHQADQAEQQENVSGIVWLTREERLKFADWLKQEAKSYEAIDKELSKLPGTAILVEMHQREAEAATIIRKMLLSIAEW
jgi:predicted acetyltransferase